jgi:hypothetical protein
MSELTNASVPADPHTVGAALALDLVETHLSLSDKTIFKQDNDNRRVMVGIGTKELTTSPGIPVIYHN